MIRTTRLLVTALTITAMIAASGAPAFAASSSSSSSGSVAQHEHDADGSPTLLDMMVMRPVGLAVLAAGTVLMVPVGAFTLMTRPKEIRQPFDALMREPAEFVFVDPVGSH